MKKKETEQHRTTFLLCSQDTDHFLSGMAENVIKNRAQENIELKNFEKMRRYTYFLTC